MIKNLEIGKLYRDAEGDMVQIVHLLSTGKYLGVIVASKKTTNIDLRLEYSESGISRSSQSNLVSECRAPIKIEGWVNIYPLGNLGGIHLTKDRADDVAQGTDRIACIKVTGQEEI